MDFKILAAAAAAILLTPGVALVGVATVVSPATACRSPADKPEPVDADASQVTLAQANIKGSLPAAAHTADLTTVVASQPDFVTLNETYFRTDAQLRPDGYSSFRAEAPFDARETPVLWRADAWQLLDSGTELMHDRAVKWGTRYANWVTLTSTQDQATVSVVSVHASPGGRGRDGLLREYVAHLDALITSLKAKGPVLVGGDLNTHHPASGFLRDWLGDSGATSTFDTLGEPAGGWATGDGGGTIDYILTAGAIQPVSHATADLAHTDHRSLTATLSLSAADPVPDPAAVPASCHTQPPGEQPTDLPDGFAGAFIAAAASQLGLPYVWGGGNFDGPTGGGFDCSGLVLYAAYQASGGQVRLPHYSGDQIRAGQAVAWEEKEPGDLIFFTYPGAGAPHHVAIYVGGDEILHAPHTGDVVRYGSVSEFAGQQMTIRRLQ